MHHNHQGGFKKVQRFIDKDMAKVKQRGQKTQL